MNKNSDKLSINSEMRAFDTKDRNFYTSLSDEEKKKFSAYLIMRWGASVYGSEDLQAYYLLAVNENVNKWLFDCNKNPDLQWLTCSTVSPKIPNVRHYWQGSKPNQKNEKDSLRKICVELMPAAKEDEIDLFIELNSIGDIENWIKDYGIEK